MFLHLVQQRSRIKKTHISDILSDLLSRHLHAREPTQYFRVNKTQGSRVLRVYLEVLFLPIQEVQILNQENQIVNKVHTVCN